MGQIVKEIKGRIVFKHQTAEDWEKSSYVPVVGEKVLYDPDETCSYTRVKYGDGERTVKDLPFSEPLSVGNSKGSIQTPGNVAGIKGYRIKEISHYQYVDGNDFNGYRETNSWAISFTDEVDTPSYPYFIYQWGMGVDILNRGVNTGWSVGDRLTIMNGNNWDNCCEILRVYGDDETGYFYEVSELPFDALWVQYTNEAGGTSVANDVVAGNIEEFNTKLDSISNKIELYDIEYCAFNIDQPANGIVDGGTDTVSFGRENKALMDAAAVFGYDNEALGKYSLVAGRGNTGYYGTFVAGGGNFAGADRSGAVGYNNTIHRSSRNSFVEGRNHNSYGAGAHTEGRNNVNKSHYTHVEGGNNEVDTGYAESDNNGYAHVENYNNKAYTLQAHVEGEGNTSGRHGGDKMDPLSGTLEKNIHIEGKGNKASGGGSHTEGLSNTNYSHFTHIEGNGNTADTDGANAYDHIEGSGNSITSSVAVNTHVEGVGNKNIIAPQAHIEGEANETKSSEKNMHIEGKLNKASGGGTHTEGLNNENNSHFTHVEGNGNVVNAIYNGINAYNHVEGVNNKLFEAEKGHIEGENNRVGKIDEGEYIAPEGRPKNFHVEGTGNKLHGGEGHMHIEGRNNTVNKACAAHAEGDKNTIEADAHWSHVGGKENTIKTGHEGAFVHGRGLQTGAKYQAVIGQYNEGKSDTLFEVGGGISATNRQNAFEVKTVELRLSDGEVYGQTIGMSMGGDAVITKEDFGQLAGFAATGISYDENTGHYVATRANAAKDSEHATTADSATSATSAETANTAASATAIEGLNEAQMGQIKALAQNGTYSGNFTVEDGDNKFEVTPYNVKYSRNYKTDNYNECTVNDKHYYPSDYAETPDIVPNKSLIDLLAEDYTVKFPISLGTNRFGSFTYNKNWADMPQNTLTKMLCRFLDQITNASLAPSRETNKAYFTGAPITVQFYAQEGYMNVTLADGSVEARQITQKNESSCRYTLMNSSQITYSEEMNSMGGEYFYSNRIWEIAFTAGGAPYCMRLWQNYGSITPSSSYGPIDGVLCNIAIYESVPQTLKVGNTELTEEQLQKILAFMDSVNLTGTFNA